MKSLNNVGAERLGDALGESIDDGAKLSTISSYFTVFAYGELKEELSKVDEVRFLFSEPTFIKRMADSKEPREFEVARRAREVGVGGSGLELTLRNNLNQRALARECAEWIRERSVFKSAKTSGAIQPGGTYVVENPSGDDHAFMGAAVNFTQEGLGYERRPGTVTCVSHFENATEAIGLKMMFESVWDNPAMVEGVTAQVAAQVEMLYRENPPEFIYFLTLYHLFRDFMEDDEDNGIRPGFKFEESVVWNKLYDFQKDAVVGAIRKLEKYKGCIIADPVGLGKIYEALAVMKYYQERNDRILVLCPKRLRDNWTLWTQDNDVSFVFSHSALKEGWDNPNVFQICTLVETKDNLTKRQKIGRGLRLCVNQNGERLYDPEANVLTVIANESYDEFANGLQKELEADDFKFGVITPESFTKVTVKSPEGVEVRLGYEKSKQVYDHLVATGMVDDKGAVTPELKAAAEEGKVELPAVLEPAKEQVEAIIIHKSQRVQIHDKAKEVSVELQKDVTLDPAFQALWDRIRRRTRFQVEVDSGKLIEHAIEAIDGMLAVRPPQVTSERASLGIDDAGVSAEGTGTSVVSVSGKVKYDLPDPIAELQDAVGLTRGTIKAILEGCSRFDEFEIDPTTFLAQVGDKINRVKNDLIAQGIKYVRLPEDEWYTKRDLELDDYTAYLGQNAWKPDMASKSLYNYVVYDSAGVERSFAEALDKQEEVLVFAKLPSAFKIDTPLGSYNPDWAYVEEADGERRVYFVTETKGGKNGVPALRDAEKIKIGCAKKHFEALHLGNDFHYNVRTTYQYEAVKA